MLQQRPSNLIHNPPPILLLLPRLQLTANKRTRYLGAELIQLRRTIPQPVVIRDIMEELLRIERASEQQRQIAIGRLDNIRNLIHRLPAVERILVRQAVLDPVRKRGELVAGTVGGTKVR
jgi:hypothetical protein